MTTNQELDPAVLWPIELAVTCNSGIFKNAPLTFDRWATINYLVGPNASGKTTFFNSIMDAARAKWTNKVKILGTGRLGPLEKSVSQYLGDVASRLFVDDNLDSVYGTLFSGQDTAHQAFQLLEKRLDLQIRVLSFLRHVFKRAVHFKPTRRGLQVLGVSSSSDEYQIVDECHGLKELITILTFLYDDTFSVLGIDEPELHLHPQFQRFLLDELRSVAGNPNETGKKLIFLVTHSPVLLELRHFGDLSSIIVFPGESSVPKRTSFDGLSDEELLKIRQALPSFNTAQRELLFSRSPVLVEGPTDTSALLNVATKLGLPIGAAGIGIAPMGGKHQLLAFRALLTSLAKANARFILDLDAALDAQTLHCLDDHPVVVANLAKAGAGGRRLSQEAGELIRLLREYTTRVLAIGKTLGPIDAARPLTEKDLAVVLRVLQTAVREAPASLSDLPAAEAILGKFALIRAAARAANVLILEKGPIEAYYESPLPPGASDFQKQRAFQGELDAIWAASDTVALEARYSELVDFVRQAGLLKVPIATMVQEPVANLIHLLQTEIAAGRITNEQEARDSSRAKADGYWYVCEVKSLSISSPAKFKGVIVVKKPLGGATYTFDQETRAYQITTDPLL